eukprot:TRINITY_DN9589_c0_g1_i4.p2 TRINITY_DN9589_c0_g1~~TRINITY_DN9589_c0_g1_i4.p2  ORF type:complete len:118 (-),score=7.29 TRINITY_DN9589_c0_g1_i4:1264-1617(-)
MFMLDAKHLSCFGDLSNSTPKFDFRMHVCKPSNRTLVLGGLIAQTAGVLGWPWPQTCCQRSCTIRQSAVPSSQSKRTCIPLRPQQRQQHDVTDLCQIQHARLDPVELGHLPDLIKRA